MSKYICDTCNYVFDTKKDLTKHNKKICDNYENVKTTMTNIFKSCLDILRNGEALTGEKALRSMTYMIVLKLIEPHFGNEIDIDNFDYEIEHLEDEYIPMHLKKLLEIVRFSNLVNEKEDNLVTNIKFLWNDILSVHPSTKNIFLKGNGFMINKRDIYKKLIQKINELPITDSDVLGGAYEEVIQDIMKGKILGQFFTPTKVKKFMVDLIKPEINKNGTIETCCDPTMGTGGFLITYIKYIIEQSKKRNIKLNWNFIKSKGLYGKEIEPDTFQLGVSNMLISTGHVFDNMILGDSIIEPINKKFDIVLANPPFGIKGIGYNNFNNSLKHEYIPIKSENAVSLFLQIIIYILKIEGKCAVVVPNGQDLFGTTEPYPIIREYLLKTCDLQEIIYFPEKTFLNTSIKTCVFYFIKKREGKDVLDINIIDSKTTNRELRRTYKFIKHHETKNVKFYEYNFNTYEKALKANISIKDISKNNYSLDYQSYINEENKTDIDNIHMKTLNEIFGEKTNNFIKIKDDKKYKVIGLSSFGFSKVKKIIKGNELKVKRQQVSKKSQFAISKIINGGYGIINDKTKSGLMSNEFWLFEINSEIALQDYIYYIFENHIKPKLNDISNGLGISRINYDKFKSIKIPIPNIEIQYIIIKRVDFYNKMNENVNTLIKNLKESNNIFIENNISRENNNVELDEVCEINYGTRIVRKNNIEGIYPVYGSGRPMFNTNTFNRKGFNILIGRFALSKECVRLVNEKLFLNDSGLSIKPKDDNLLHKFLGYYILKISNTIYDLSRGLAQRNLDIEKFKKIKIPLIPLEKQQEIIDYCELNNKRIKEINDIINQNKINLDNYFNDKINSINPIEIETKPKKKIVKKVKQISDSYESEEDNNNSETE